MAKDTQKIDKQTLKEDEVGEAAVVLFRKVMENKHTVLAVLILVATLIIGYRVYIQHQQNENLKISDILSEAQSFVSQASQAKTDMESKDLYQKAIKRYQDAVTQYPNTEGGKEALYLQGNVYYEMKDFDNAIATYSKYIDKVSDNIGKAKGYIALGYSYENSSFFSNKDNAARRSMIDKAIDYYQQSIKVSNGNYLKYQALLSLGRCYEAENENQKAIDAYKQILSRPKTAQEKSTKAVSPFATESIDKIAKENMDRLQASLQIKK